MWQDTDVMTARTKTDNRDVIASGLREVIGGKLNLGHKLKRSESYSKCLQNFITVTNI